MPLNSDARLRLCRLPGDFGAHLGPRVDEGDALVAHGVPEGDVRRFEVAREEAPQSGAQGMVEGHVELREGNELVRLTIVHMLLH